MLPVGAIVTRGTQALVSYGDKTASAGTVSVTVAGNTSYVRAMPHRVQLGVVPLSMRDCNN